MGLGDAWTVAWISTSRTMAQCSLTLKRGFGFSTLNKSFQPRFTFQATVMFRSINFATRDQFTCVMFLQAERHGSPLVLILPVCWELADSAAAPVGSAVATPTADQRLRLVPHSQTAQAPAETWSSCSIEYTKENGGSAQLLVASIA